MEAVIVFVPTANRSPLPTHAPRVGCDGDDGITPNARRCFNSRTPCGVRPYRLEQPPDTKTVSIHAPRVGCDYNLRRGKSPSKRFNSRTPCGVRQEMHSQSIKSQEVSIHAPRVGCDLQTLSKRNKFEVSIHAPRVGCDSGEDWKEISWQKFQFTHPVWGATELREIVQLDLPVSIHAPRVGCDTGLLPYR